MINHYYNTIDCVGVGEAYFLQANRFSFVSVDVAQLT